MIKLNGLFVIAERNIRLDVLIADYEAIEAHRCAEIMRSILSHFPGENQTDDSDEAWDALYVCMPDDAAENAMLDEWREASCEIDVQLIRLWWRDRRKHFPNVP